MISDDVAKVAASIVVLGLVYAYAWHSGRRDMARRTRAPHEPCWRCDGSGIERTK